MCNSGPLSLADRDAGGQTLIPTQSKGSDHVLAPLPASPLFSFPLGTTFVKDITVRRVPTGTAAGTARTPAGPAPRSAP